MQEKRFPSTAATASTDPYCGNCGYSLKGLNESTRCPECGKPIIDVLMRPGFGPGAGKRYRSKTMLFGLPVVDVALGPFGAERRGRARGIIAIGDLALGWLAIGGAARGIVAIGGVSVGVFSVGGAAVGLLSAFGGLAVSLGIANGGISIGAISAGGLAVGLLAQGGFAAGMFARGGLAIGKAFPAGASHLRWLLGNFPPNRLDTLRPMLFTLLPALLCGVSICILAIGRCRWVTRFIEKQ